MAFLVIQLSCEKVDEHPSHNTSELYNNSDLQAVLWQQHAGEYKALCYQAYNFAKQSLMAYHMEPRRKYAIITDIDETVLDNSPFNGMMTKYNKSYKKEDWMDWGRLAQANLIPGAFEFFNYADSMGVVVFYISNRYDTQLPETLQNLKNHGLPNVDSNHVFLKTSTSEKQDRRNVVLRDYEVLLYLGDNLSDFMKDFDDINETDRNALTDKHSVDFGKKFIVFPNPMYGDWEKNGILEGDKHLDHVKANMIRYNKLKSFK